MWNLKDDMEILGNLISIIKMNGVYSKDEVMRMFRDKKDHQKAINKLARDYARIAGRSIVTEFELNDGFGLLLLPILEGIMMIPILRSGKRARLNLPMEQTLLIGDIPAMIENTKQEVEELSKKYTFKEKKHYEN